ncbi:MAG: anti-sigma factor [Alphaproteobacteria bacterium]|nr:MAG: anti-sigma factor [Alphaproteobacteria bacterium]
MTDDLDMLAAEYALGLLEGEERAEAHALFESDESFRRRVGAWTGRLAPLLDEAEPQAPPAELWSKIERRIAPPPAASNVVVLRRKLSLWRGYAAAATALAASLALFLVTRPEPAPPRAEAPMVAMMEAAGSGAKLVATYDAASRSLVVAPAAGITRVAGHSHELWAIPADGKPRPMGIVRPGAPQRMDVPPEMAPAFAGGVTLALSVEPEGGSPTGQPTGPVIASGRLART